MVLGWWLWACAGEGPAPVAAPAPDAPVPVAAPAPPDPPAFRWVVEPLSEAVRAGMVGRSWREGCPTPLDDLRWVTVSHWDFDGQVSDGQLVLHHDATDAARGAFEAAFLDRFPIRSVRPIDAFDGSDDRSMAADNTSAFNCRPIKGTSAWSEHATGRAIDVNPRENPWVKGDRVDPPDGAPFLARDPATPGLLVADSAMVRAFRAAGWGWGGTWSSLKDYQHFSASGR